MNCGNCGGKLQVGDSFCRHCGMPSYAGKKHSSMGASVLLAFLLFVTFGSAIYPILNNKVSNEIRVYREGALRHELGDFVFYLPPAYSLEVKNNHFLFSDEEETFAASFSPQGVSLSVLKEKSDLLAEDIEARGCKVLRTNEKIIEKVDYLINEATCSGDAYIFAYGKINAGSVAEIIIYNTNGSHDVSFLEDASLIILSAEVGK